MLPNIQFQCHISVTSCMDDLSISQLITQSPMLTSHEAYVSLHIINYSRQSQMYILSENIICTKQNYRRSDLLCLSYALISLLCFLMGTHEIAWDYMRAWPHLSSASIASIMDVFWASTVELTENLSRMRLLCWWSDGGYHMWPLGILHIHEVKQ